MRFTKIDKVGVELEGGWNAPYADPADGRLYCRTNVHEHPREGVPWNVMFKGDGSVRGVDGVHIGEVVCAAPIKPSQAMTWVMHNHPHSTNDSCGLHVHMSFKRLFDYERLMNPEFNTYFRKEIRRWAEVNDIKGSFWQRFNGHNQYCLSQFRPQQQINSSLVENSPYGYTRYTQLNFAAWQQHKTLECRLLPMFPEPEVSAKAVDRVIRIVERFLQQPDTRDTASLRKVVRVSAVVGEALRAAQEQRKTDIIIKLGGKVLAAQEKRFLVKESEALASDMVIRTTTDIHQSQRRGVAAWHTVNTDDAF